MKYTMDLRRKPLRGIRAMSIILLIVAVILLVSLVASTLSSVFSGAGYIAYAAVLLLAYVVYRQFVLEYRYTLDERGVLRIERLAGQRVRPLEQIALADIAYYGDVAGVPEGDKTRRYTLSGNANPERALLSKGEHPLLTVIQPDDKLDGMILEAIRGSMKKEQA